MSGRLPFDPSRLVPAQPDPSRAPTPARDAASPLSVTQLAVVIDHALRAGVPAQVRVRGEISGLRERTHLYFTLKDASALVSAVMFASTARRTAADLVDGMEVIVTGRVDFHGATGRVSLIVDRAEPVGRGELERKLKETLDALRQRGWLDDARKRPLPLLPRRVAVVTSRTGAALQDVIDTARRRCPAVSLAVVDVRVQGDGAAAEIAGAIRSLSRAAEALGIDAVLVTRGGGSIEDLWAFNEVEVAEAIVGCVVPVVAAIGHETDTTIAELVADLRAATPTQAAMRLVPDRADLLRQVAALHSRARAATSRRAAFARQRLDGLTRRPALARPQVMTERRRAALAALAARLVAAAHRAVHVAQRRLARDAVRLEGRRPAAEHARRAARVEHAEARLAAALRRRLAEARRAVASLTRELEAVGPGQVLSRGYSVTLDPQGRAVRSSVGVPPGELLRTVLRDGVINSRVEGRGDGQGPQPPPRPTNAPRAGRDATPRGPGRGRRGRDQMDLFGGGG